MSEYLKKVWEEQAAYNAKVKQLQERPSAEWMQTYILGVMTECGELLEAMRWKRNRLEEIEEFGPNVPEELADITKYVFSMWQLMGYGPESMLDFIQKKNWLLDILYRQEFEVTLQKNIVVFDMDNVLTMTQEALAAHLELNEFSIEKLQSSLHLDLATSQRFDEYRILKNKWEADGGYASLKAIYHTRRLFMALRDLGMSVVVWTARPVGSITRVKRDTFEWFMKHQAVPDICFFGREERISWITAKQRSGYNVVLVEDDPSMVQRAVNSGIRVIVPTKPYNSKVSNFNGDGNNLVKRIQEELTYVPDDPRIFA